MHKLSFWIVGALILYGSTAISKSDSCCYVRNEIYEGPLEVYHTVNGIMTLPSLGTVASTHKLSLQESDFPIMVQITDPSVNPPITKVNIPTAGCYTISRIKAGKPLQATDWCKS